MNTRLLVICFLISTFGFAQTPEGEVRAVVSSAYIGGIHNGGSIDDIRNGFHPTFNMLRLTDNEIKPLPIEDWITSIEKGRQAQSSRPASTPTVGKFISVDVTGNAAVVKLELFKGEKKTFTDYIVLYKFTEGWKIVSKTYFRH